MKMCTYVQIQIPVKTIKIYAFAMKTCAFVTPLFYLPPISVPYLCCKLQGTAVNAFRKAHDGTVCTHQGDRQVWEEYAQKHISPCFVLQW